MAEPPEKESEELLDDLESIRTLLDDEDAAQGVQPAGADAEAEVPMLDDVVDLHDAGGDSDAMPGILTDDVFDSLLGDGWKDKADGLLEDARHTIDDQAERWSPEDTDELNEALRVRIDGTIYQWLQQMLTEHIDDLRAQVLDAMSDEIKARVKQALGEGQNAAKSPDGPPKD
ncbi:MAG: hypothetical protein ACR2PZ_18530 [Pseudomonadales bacterium]